MSIMLEIAVVFGVCLVSEGLAALLPMDFPASVIAMLLLLLLLLLGWVRERHIERLSNFFVQNMAFFFIPACVGIMEQFQVLLPCLVPFLAICLISTPLVYVATAWAVRLTMRLMGGEELPPHD